MSSIKRRTGHVGVPVYEGAIRIILLSPDMQCIKRRQSKAVGTLKIMEELTHQLGRAISVLCIPHVGKNQIVSADQFQASIKLRLVDYDLWTRGISDSATHKRRIYVMQTHGAGVRPLTHPKCSVLPSRSATATAWKRAVDSRTTLTRVLAWPS